MRALAIVLVLGGCCFGSGGEPETPEPGPVTLEGELIAPAPGDRLFLYGSAHRVFDVEVPARLRRVK